LKFEVSNWKLKTPNWKQETENSKLKIFKVQLIKKRLLTTKIEYCENIN